jgi:hypothetical protein
MPIGEERRLDEKDPYGNEMVWPSPPPSPCFLAMTATADECTDANSGGPILSSDECMRYRDVLAAQGVTVAPFFEDLPRTFVVDRPAFPTGCFVTCSDSAGGGALGVCEAGDARVVAFNTNAANGGSHAFRVCRCAASPGRPPSAEDAVFPEDAEAWWRHLETRFVPEEGHLYARRVPPTALGHSAAASVALAITLVAPQKLVSAQTGHDATLEDACRWLGGPHHAKHLQGCTDGDFWTLVYDRADANNATRSTEASAPLPPTDDAGWALVLLSTAIQPAVHTLLTEQLVCASRELCGGDGDGDAARCRACDPLTVGTASREDVLRRVEAGLGVAPASASRSVVACVQRAECLAEVASEVAVASGASVALPLTQRLVRVAAANAALLQDARRVFSTNRSWTEHDARRREMLVAHARALPPPLPNAVVAPLAARARAGEGEGEGEGRRLGVDGAAAAAAAREAQAQAPPSPLVAALRAQTNATCREMATDEHANALRSHAESTRLWVQLRGGGNAPLGQGAVCVDCQFPNRTHACRTHFALVGRMLTRMRLVRDARARAAPEKGFAPGSHRRRVLEEAVREHVDQSCCARFADGHEECDARFCAIHARATLAKRAAHVARNMHNAEVGFGPELDVEAHAGMDFVNTDLHHDPECRGLQRARDERPGGPLHVECQARTVLHHLSKKHGLSYDAIKDKIGGMGVELGDTLLHAAHVMGLATRADDGAGADAGDADAGDARRRRAEDARVAAELMDAARARGRRLGDAPTEAAAGRAVPRAVVAGTLRRQLHNASETMHRRMMRIDARSTVLNNELARAPRTGRRRHEPEAPRWHGVNALMAIQMQEGSFFTRVSGTLDRLDGLRRRVTQAVDVTRKRLHAQDRAARGRRTAIDANAHAASRLYDALEARMLQHHRRALDDGPPAAGAGTLELPETHALQWVHELVDWPHVVEEGRRVYEVAKRRMRDRDEGRKHGEIVARHPTGYALLDDQAVSRPTPLGDAVRRLASRRERGVDPVWFEHSVARRVHRRLDEHHATEGATTRAVRQLELAFFEGTLAAPFVFYDSVSYYGTAQEASEISFWEASIRYVVSSTLSCYFVAPKSVASTTQGGGGGESPDGDTIRVLRPAERKLCFPAIPFSFPPMQSFRRLTNSEGVDLKNLTYERYCTHDGAIQETASALESVGLDPLDEDALTPNAAILRGAEAIDSVHNFRKSGSSESNRVAAGHVLCGITQLGGLIYTAFVLTVTLILLTCLPFVNFFFQLLFDGVCLVGDVNSVVGKAKQLNARLKGDVRASLTGARFAPIPGEDSVPFLVKSS